MLSQNCKYGIIISKVPVMQNGLGEIMAHHFPEYEFNCCNALEELTLLQLRRAVLIIADLSGDLLNARAICEHYYTVLSQFHDIQWIFLVPRSLYSSSVEFLMRPESTLLSNVESIDGVINAIRAGSQRAEKISQMLISPGFDEELEKSRVLTLSERQVLRLIGKGWCINQIAMLLRKSNKTVSAQKNSAMRRLALRSNAEMYAWINSSQGMRELNLSSVYGEHTEWKNIPQSGTLLSSKTA